MIQIVKAPYNDSRPVDGKVDQDKLWNATHQHTSNVSDGMEFFMAKMQESSEAHDWTKFQKFFEYLEAMNSGAIRQSDWYKYHITTERHHLAQKVPADVNLIDVMEYISDCVMAGAVRGNPIYINLSDDLLQKALQNTVLMLRDQVEVINEHGT